MALNVLANNALCLAAVLLARPLRGGCKMAAPMAVQVTMYLTEGDSWHHRPLHLEVLRYLRQENVAGAVAFHSGRRVSGPSGVQTAHLVEAGGELPVVITFVDTDEHVSRALCPSCGRWRRIA